MDIEYFLKNIEDEKFLINLLDKYVDAHYEEYKNITSAHIITIKQSLWDVLGCNDVIQFLKVQREPKNRIREVEEELEEFSNLLLNRICHGISKKFFAKGVESTPQSPLKEKSKAILNTWETSFKEYYSKSIQIFTEILKDMIENRLEKGSKKYIKKKREYSELTKKYYKVGKEIQEQLKRCYKMGGENKKQLEGIIQMYEEQMKYLKNR